MTKLMFSQLSLREEILAAIHDMGFSEATDIQAEAIPVIRSGADVLARSQTGTGKTLAFGIPAVEAVDPKGVYAQVLVLSPTRELSKQCGDEIRKLAKHLPRVKTADILGGGDYRNQFRDLQKAQIIIGTPGRIMDHIDRSTLLLDQLKMVILDEADEMLNMGFREDIEVILRDAPEDRQTILFSATIPPEILSIASQFQKDPVHIEINREQVTLDNIKQIFMDIPMHRKQDALLLMLHYYRPRRAIIFANTKSMVDELSEQLSAEGFSVEGLHGDMKQLQRTTVMNGFKKGRVNLLVATDVAARGIDVSDIDYVFNFDIPKEMEYYVHRIGRTGRAGRRGTAVTLCCGKQQIIQMQRLARRTHASIEQAPIPTVEMIAQENQNRMFSHLAKAMEQDVAPQHVEMLQRLLDQGYEAEQVAATLLQLHFPEKTQKLQNIPESRKARREEESLRRGNKRYQGKMAQMMIDIGASSRVAVNHIVGAVTERGGVSALDLGKIQVQDDFTLVAVPEDRAEEIIESMRGCKICRKPVHVSLLEEPKRRLGKFGSKFGGKGKKPAGKSTWSLGKKRNHNKKELN